MLALGESELEELRLEIVEGAVSLVDRALTRLSDENVVDLDEDRRATMFRPRPGACGTTSDQALYPCPELRSSR